MSGCEARSLFNALRVDGLRLRRPFSADLATAHEVIFDDGSQADEKAKALSLWLQANQPCLFGRIAAAAGRIHYCILTESEHLRRMSDDEIRETIERDKKVWRQRSLDGARSPEHGFLLLVASPVVAIAKPDDNLKAFAMKIQELAGWAVEPDEYGNDRAFERLFLKNPRNGSYCEFVFGIDFFASAGDGRWWQDHRIPGGIAFTANSLGHMMQTREWYEAKTNQEQWSLFTAMRTIDEAQTTDHGKATWLIDVVQGRPHKPLPCPFHDPSKVPPKLVNKDWTTYEGYLHTDHGIRSEFFQETRDGRPPTLTKPWIMDFAYIFNKADPDWVKFMGGRLISEKEVYAVTGDPSEWRVRSDGPPLERSPETVARITAALRRCEGWALSPAVLGELDRGYEPPIG